MRSGPAGVARCALVAPDGVRLAFEGGFEGKLPQSTKAYAGRSSTESLGYTTESIMEPSRTHISPGRRSSRHRLSLPDPASRTPRAHSPFAG